VIEVSLLGPPRVERDGALVPFDTRKAMALLAHLAVTERPRPRDSLADLLWPVSDPERARRFGEAGRVRAGREFSWDTVAARTVQVYERALAKRR